MFVFGKICILEVSNSRHKSLINIDTFNLVVIDCTPSNINCLKQAP